MTVIVVSIVVIILFGIVSLQLGVAKTKKNLAEKQAKESKEDADISSKPYISNPFSKMRNKK